MRAAKDPRILAADAEGAERTRNLQSEKHVDQTSADQKPGALDQPVTPRGPVPAEQGIAMEDTSFIYGDGPVPVVNNDLGGLDPADVADMFDGVDPHK